MEKTENVGPAEIGVALCLHTQVAGECHGRGGLQRDMSSLLFYL